MTSGYRYEQMFKKELEKNGFLVIRSAGSFFMDLIAVKKGQVFLIEIKSSKSNVHYLNGRCRNQMALLKESEKFGLKSYYAVWFKNKGWKIVRSDPKIKKIDLSINDKNNLFIAQKR